MWLIFLLTFKLMKCYFRKLSASRDIEGRCILSTGNMHEINQFLQFNFYHLFIFLSLSFAHKKRAKFFHHQIFTMKLNKIINLIVDPNRRLSGYARGTFFFLHALKLSRELKGFRIAAVANDTFFTRADFCSKFCGCKILTQRTW